MTIIWTLIGGAHIWRPPLDPPIASNEKLLMYGLKLENNKKKQVLIYSKQTSVRIAVTDPGFPQGGGREPSIGGGVNTQFCHNSPRNVLHEIGKQFGRRGGGVRPSRPPLDPATG